METVNSAPETPSESILTPLRTSLIQSVRLVIILTVVTGILYPLGIWVISQALFPVNANGSLLTANGQVIGATWIGQQFDDPSYFWSRPSFTAPAPYNAAASSGSNFGMNDPRLTNAVGARITALRTNDPSNTTPIPVDLVTASGSGLDPHISPAAARYQIPRIARVRGLSVMQVDELVNTAIEERQFGILGEPRVNVVLLNQRLDQVTKPVSP